MGELLDKIRGKVKEATGKATGDRSLEVEGKGEKWKGVAKEKFEDVKHDVREVVRNDPKP